MDYTAEPTHSDRLDIQQAQPFNAEPSAADLVEFSLTPEELVYCRNHGPVLHFDEETYFVTFKGGEKGDVRLSVAELKAACPKATIVAALQVGHLPASTYSELNHCFSALEFAGKKWDSSSLSKASHGPMVSLQIAAGEEY